jgi:hypothetical protein
MYDTIDNNITTEWISLLYLSMVWVVTGDYLCLIMWKSKRWINMAGRLTSCDDISHFDRLEIKPQEDIYCDISIGLLWVLCKLIIEL